MTESPVLRPAHSRGSEITIISVAGAVLVAAWRTVAKVECARQRQGFYLHVFLNSSFPALTL